MWRKPLETNLSDSGEMLDPGGHMRAMFCLVLSLILVPACEENLSPEASVRNRTLQAIEVFREVEGQESLVVSLPEPVTASHDQTLFVKSQAFPEGCTTGDLVARTPYGDEVARLADELCINQVWVIEPDGTSRVLG